MRTLRTIALAATVGALLVSCGGLVSVPAPYSGPKVTERTSPLERAELFDRALAVGQGMNLSVKVLEKDSGLIRFESVRLTPGQLDSYCSYPFRNASGGDWDNFHGWNDRSMRTGNGSVSGVASMNLLLTVVDGATRANLRTTFSAGNNNETHSCQSKGVLEEEFFEQLGLDSGGAPGYETEAGFRCRSMSSELANRCRAGVSACSGAASESAFDECMIGYVETW